MNILQGLASIGLLLSEQSIEKPIILGYSIEKFSLLIFCFLSILILGLTLFVQFKYHSIFENNIQKILLNKHHLIKVVSLSLFVLTEITSLYLYSISPLYISKLWPFLSWVSIFLFELYLLSEYIKVQSNLPQSSSPQIKTAKTILGIVLFVLGIFISLLTKYSILFVDEGDHITTGWLITQGFKLYSDIFSHHPPLVYYWVAGMVKLLGNDFVAIRMSIVGLWIIIFLITAFLIKNFLPVALFVFIWSGLSFFYLGNLVLYHAITGTFLAASVITFLSLSKKLSVAPILWISLLCGLTTLSDPQALPASGILLLGSAFFIIFNFRPLSKKEIFKFVTILFFPFILVIGIQSLVFIINGSLNDFINEAILFNVNIYSHYTRISSLNPFSSALRQFVNGLFVLNPNFRNYNELVRDLSLPIQTTIDHWLFGGFYFRLGIIIISIALVIIKKDFRGFFLYLITCTLFPRTGVGFQALAFIMVAISTITIFTFSNWETKKRKFSPQIIYIGMQFTLLWFLIALLFSAARTIVFDFEENKKNFEDQLQSYYERKNNYLKYECEGHRFDYLIYPLDPLFYFIANRYPASKYHFMTPWVAEIGQNEVINDLSITKKAVVIIGLDGVIWGYPVKTYLSTLINYLDTHYIKVEPGIWISPSAFQSCQQTFHQQENNHQTINDHE
ncbi:ArnT family glycosyltransferase [Anaerolinea thermolimosa]|nr:hypothetical protein [Anaerolinea thermolimosa]